MSAVVVAVHRRSEHAFSKDPVAEIELVAQVGVRGDAHAGATVKHRSRVAKDPTQPNLRQVHLMHTELFDDLRARGFDVSPGQLGENISTRGLDLLGLSEGALLRIGATAVVRVTGLRNPCVQIDGFQKGLLAAVLGRSDDGVVVRQTGIMGVVEQGGVIRPGDPIHVSAPDAHVPLRVV